MVLLLVSAMAIVGGRWLGWSRKRLVREKEELRYSLSMPTALVTAGFLGAVAFVAFTRRKKPPEERKKNASKNSIAIEKTKREATDTSELLYYSPQQKVQVDSSPVSHFALVQAPSAKGTLMSPGAGSTVSSGAPEPMTEETCQDLQPKLEASSASPEPFTPTSSCREQASLLSFVTPDKVDTVGADEPYSDQTSELTQGGPPGAVPEQSSSTKRPGNSRYVPEACDVEDDQECRGNRESGASDVTVLRDGTACQPQEKEEDDFLALLRRAQKAASQLKEVHAAISKQCAIVRGEIASSPSRPMSRGGPGE